MENKPLEEARRNYGNAVFRLVDVHQREIEETIDEGETVAKMEGEMTEENEEITRVHQDLLKESEVKRQEEIDRVEKEVIECAKELALQRIEAKERRSAETR